MAVTAGEFEQAAQWLTEQLSKGPRRPTPLVMQGVIAGLNPSAIYETIHHGGRFKVTKWEKDVWWEIANG